MESIGNYKLKCRPDFSKYPLVIIHKYFNINECLTMCNLNAKVRKSFKLLSKKLNYFISLWDEIKEMKSNYTPSKPILINILLKNVESYISTHLVNTKESLKLDLLCFVVIKFIKTQTSNFKIPFNLEFSSSQDFNFSSIKNFLRKPPTITGDVNNTKLTYLNFEVSYDFILSIIKNTSIKDLVITQNMIEQTKKLFNYFIQFLSCNKNIKILNLELFKLNIHQLKNILSGLENNKNLILKLIFEIYEDSFDQSCQFIYENNLPESEILTIQNSSKYPIKNFDLKIMKICFNFNFIKNYKIIIPILNNNSLNREKLEFFLKMMNANLQIKELKMSYNNIDDYDCYLITENLYNLANLESLDLSYNNITSESALLLASKFVEIFKIGTLNLSNNKLKEEDILELKNIFKKKKKLHLVVIND